MLRVTEDGFIAGGFVQVAHAPEVKYAQDSMELLYLWIGKDDTCFIQQQGFNFSPNYQFTITDMGVDGYQLDWSEKREHFNVWNHQNIVNLTAIVGKNGTGKTTLLRYLTAAPVMLTDKESDDELVQIYRIGNSIKIFNKLNKVLRFDAERKCGGMHVSVANQGEDGKLLHHQTVVLMSNAWSDMFFDGVGAKYKPIIFAPKKNDERSEAFFRKKSGLKLDMPENFRELQEEIVSQKNSKSFENLAVVSYYSQIQSGRFADTHNTGFTVDVVNPTNWIHPDWIPRQVAKEENYQRQDGKTFRALLLEYLNLLKTKEYKDIHEVLRDNLCFEVLFQLSNVQQAFDDPVLFSEIRKDPVQYLMNNSADICDGVIEYYRQAQQEIIQFREVLLGINLENWLVGQKLREMQELLSMLEPADSEPKAFGSPCSIEGIYGNEDGFEYCNAEKFSYSSGTGRAIVLKRGSMRYALFCEFVDKQMKMPTSFVLKHLIVTMPHQSSGEWAMQNIFSWLRLSPYFQEIVDEDSFEVGGNMLLMLDEVDLYMHPEWQRKFLKLLSDRLDQEYRDKKIQVIITTHSPLVLSDIPRENVVYLKRDGNKCKIVDGPDMEESFGANIFSLLKDSFFLSKTMGEFARTRIDKVIDDLEKLKKAPQDLKLKKECRQLIEHIGEPIIRKKLMMMYNEAVGSDPAYLDRQSLERFSRLLESRDPEVGRQVRELVRRYLTENEPG